MCGWPIPLVYVATNLGQCWNNCMFMEHYSILFELHIILYSAFACLTTFFIVLKLGICSSYIIKPPLLCNYEQLAWNVCKNIAMTWQTICLLAGFIAYYSVIWWMTGLYGQSTSSILSFLFRSSIHSQLPPSPLKYDSLCLNLSLKM